MTTETYSNSPSDSQSGAGTSICDEAARCVKCKAPTYDFAVCRACGYYEKLGKFVDIDHEMEGFETEKEPEPFRVPTWAFGAIIGCIGILAEAITLSLILPINTIERLVCSILHIVVGVVVLLVAQVRASFLAMIDDTELAILDCIACPPRPWGAVVRRLPDSKRLITMLATGMMAVLMSLIVLRTIPWMAIFNGEVPPKMKSPVVDKIMGMASGSEEAELEDAVKELAEKGAGNLESTPEDELTGELDSELETIEHTSRAVVIGYTASNSQPVAVRTVIVATADLNPLSSEKWRVLGSVPIIDEEVGVQLYSELSPKHTANPITQTTHRATWVKPSVRCEVSYQERGEQREPYALELKQLF